MFDVGTGKAEITAFKAGVGMMGYGMHFNTVDGIETPLYARAYVFRSRSSGKKFVFVNAEMCFIGTALRMGVLKRLDRHHPEMGFSDANVLLTAQHTHSGPGGYNHYGLYNLSIPGFVPEVYQQIVEGLVKAIVEAEGSIRPARIFFGQGEFPIGEEVAFNRSLRAYNSNPDVIEKVSLNESQKAVDRRMTLLRIEGEDGEPIGQINWFAVHTTSISNDDHKISPDNKGYASAYFEEHIQQTQGASQFLAAFAQGAAGDVSPNYIWDRKKKWTRGKFEDDFESARFNARLQFKKALEIYTEAPEKGELQSSEVDYAIMHVNFANVVCDPEFTDGKTDARTGPSCHGVSFFAGTAEGPGMNKPTVAISNAASIFMKWYEYARSLFVSKEKRTRIRQKYKIQGKKRILVETGERKVLATHDVKNLIVPGFVDKSLKTFKQHHRRGGLDDKPWTPQVVPLHVIILGEIALIALPCEPTTISGKRITEVARDILAQRGIKEVILAPYANAYCGYIATYEEYQFQFYEGGHTVFGEYTLAAFQTKIKQLCKEMTKKAGHREIIDDGSPVTFTSEELKKRTFDESPF